MAEGGSDPSSRKVQQLCRYFIHGACDRGDSCRFLHDRSGKAAPNNVCKFYKQGQCVYGNRCRYDHIRGDEFSKQPNYNIKERGRPTVNDKPKQNKLQSVENRESTMVTLKKGGTEDYKTRKPQPDRRKNSNENWAKAKDFIPGQKFHAGATYARAANKKHTEEEGSSKNRNRHDWQAREVEEEELLCPYFAQGECPFGPKCSYIHGDVCDICQFPRLHPTDQSQREAHQKECLKEMEKDMENAFAMQESQNKECCICLELVLEKVEKDQQGATKKGTSSAPRFGILENCTHCFCLSCIRRWRSDKSFGKNVRMCPICRVHSDFVTPSKVWVEDEEAKKKFIQDYKDALSKKNCQYFKQGKGECPFNEKCFYKHAYPDGTIAEPKPRKPRRRVNADGEMSLQETLTLWEFLEGRAEGLMSLEDELSMFLLGMLPDDDDDDPYFSLFGFDTPSFTDSDSDTDVEFLY